MLQDTRSDQMFDLSNKLFTFILLMIIVYPLIYVTSASFSDPVYVHTGKVWLWPLGFTIEGYVEVFKNAEIWSGYRNTIFYTLGGTFINLFVTLPCAYALSRQGVKGRNLVMAMLVFTMFFQGGIIPTFLVIKGLGLIDTIWAMLLPNAATVWNIIVTRTFFQSTIPKELEEAAEMDGCSVVKTFFMIVLPLSAPIIAVMGLFYGVWHWNQYFNAMMYISNRELYPLQLILREILVLNQQVEPDSQDLAELLEQERVADIMKYAVMIVSAVPLLMVYPFLQRFFVKGVLIGSIKG